MKKILVLVIFLMFCEAFGQGSSNIVQFSGLIVGGDSLYGIPGVTVYVPKAGRGTLTNDAGFFTLPTLVGDTVIIAALGYKKKEIVVPKSEKQSVTLIVELTEDTIYLPIVEIFPYPTEEVFKQAFLSMSSSDQWNYNRMSNNLDPRLLAKLIRNAAPSSGENARYSLRNQMYPGGSIGNTQGFQMFNPYAWSNLVRTVRKNKSKSAYDE
ncbi:MAG: carboxypeptidase-like regulatory domain-containing protein [Bacteroidota bacterium]|nr:carboxypeptidase-like regulatory domain-containing protein [Bacteroidota bacterium]